MIGLQATSNATDVAAGLRAVSDGIEDQLEQLVATLTEYLEDALQETVPKKTGKGAESIHGDAAGLTSSFMGADYLGYVIGGTTPHTISGNPLLAFYWEKMGANVVFASVHHPGTKANDFRVTALANTSGQAEDELQALADWAAETMAA